MLKFQQCFFLVNLTCLLVSSTVFKNIKSDISSSSLVHKRTLWQPSIGSNGIVYFTLRPPVNNNANGNTATGSTPAQQGESNALLPQAEEADRQALLLLNSKRADHGSRPLAFNSGLKALAVECAAACQEVSSTSGTSPNSVLLSSLTQTACYTAALGNDTAIYFYESADRLPLSAFSSAINDWYNEDDGYNYANPDKATIRNYEHFTQLLWNGTRFFGGACFPTPVGQPVTTTTTVLPLPPVPAPPTPPPPRRYACSFAFRPGGNVRRRFDSEEFDEYKKNVKPLLP